MRLQHNHLWLAIQVSLSATSMATAAVTTESLFAEMTDLGRLTKLPSPAYTTRQFSSYNRQSKSPDDAAGWFANADRGEYLRVEERDGRQEFVMMDADGPGAIVRIWSADPKGILRVYLDDAEKPIVAADMKALLSGQFPGLPPPIACETARGFNLYFPIPYARHCKVTADQGHTYYHVNYRTYAAGTEVHTFASDDLQRWKGRIHQVASDLALPAPYAPGAQNFVKRIEPGETTTLLELTGPKVIQELQISLTSPEDQAAAVRGTVLSITFDGETTVETPVGDFFGTAPGLNPYESLPLSVRSASSRMISRWWMPFRSKAVLTVKNLTGKSVQIEGSAAVKKHDWDDSSLLFHAKWRIERDMPVKPFADWTHLKCTGNGRFVGGALDIMNPIRNWWGEGDEKIYVDGEKFPSHFGTGSEDYYGYAWCSPQIFAHAYHNQPRCDGPGNRGHTSDNRFHILDDIPFTRDFKFDMEMIHHAGLKGFDLTVKTMRAAVSYWYARPGGTDEFKPITREDIQPVPVPAERKAAAPPPASQPNDAITLSWQKDLLTLYSTRLPSGKLNVQYLEGFVRRGTTHRLWDQSLLPCRTELVDEGPRHRRLRLRSLVDGKVEVRHDIRSTADDVDFQLELENKSDQPVDIDWGQACIRVPEFTGRRQDDYFERCFIFTDRGLTFMHQTHRAMHALYTPGQVYVPAGIDPEDVNPRPVSDTRPVNGLVGCLSADNKLILATAWSRTQELFQGIIVCIHSDFRIGGLGPKETKRLHGKIYLVESEPRKLIDRYQRDFGWPKSVGEW